MKITVVGAGAMGGSYGGMLAMAGHQVSLIDTWQDHVAAINRDGLRIDGVLGEHRIRLDAATAPVAGMAADAVIVFVDTNNTDGGAAFTAEVLGADGFAITFQNGIGNVEKALNAIWGVRKPRTLMRRFPDYLAVMVVAPLLVLLQ